MKRQLLTLLVFALTFISYHTAFSQTYYRLKKKPGKVTLTPYHNSEIVMLRISGLFDRAKKVIYLDTINHYQAIVPKKMEMQETNNLYNFCYTIPREEGRDNAICVNSAPKKDYETLDKFTSHVLADPKYFGEKPTHWLWGEESFLLSTTQEAFHSYSSHKAVIQYKDRKLNGQFIILETPKSFLWINFVADEATFEEDIAKFADFLKGFELLD